LDRVGAERVGLIEETDVNAVHPKTESGQFAREPSHHLGRRPIGESGRHDNAQYLESSTTDGLQELALHDPTAHGVCDSDIPFHRSIT
jgi:hypothetical protein